MYRAGIIGCGRIGAESPDSHLQAYRDCDDVDLVSLCDLDKAKLSKNQEYGNIYREYEKMLTCEDLDIISVCTSPETHSVITCFSAKYVKAINCEKPIAETLEDADRMIEACDKHGVILQVNHQRRFVKSKFKWSRGILNNGTHAFDLMRQLGILDKVDMEYIDSDEYIFGFDLEGGRPILKGVEHLVECLKEGKQSISSGREARDTLYMVLKFKEE